MPTILRSTPLEAAKIADVPPSALQISRLPAASASVCLAPELISGKETLVSVLANSLLTVCRFLSMDGRDVEGRFDVGDLKFFRSRGFRFGWFVTARA